jgi:phage shock protein A
MSGGLNEDDKELVKRAELAFRHNEPGSAMIGKLLSVIRVLDVGCAFGDLAVTERNLAQEQVRRLTAERVQLSREVDDIAGQVKRVDAALADLEKTNNDVIRVATEAARKLAELQGTQ